MAEKLVVGDPAPNFDLTSTEDVVLMLCDEVPRMAVVLYVFADPEDARVRQDLEALTKAHQSLQQRRAVILAMSPTKLEVLKQLQKELVLSFPLLHDDRKFSVAYGVDSQAEGQVDPVLLLVDRDQNVRWIASPSASASDALEQLAEVLRRQPSPTYHYPAKVVNRVVDWWTNKVRRRRLA